MGNTNGKPNVYIPGSYETLDNDPSPSTISDTCVVSSESSFVLSEGAIPDSFEDDAPNSGLNQEHNMMDTASNILPPRFDTPTEVLSGTYPQVIDTYQPMKSGDPVGEDHEDIKGTSTGLDIPNKVGTYADLTNLATRFPDSAIAILKLPLPATSLDIIRALNTRAVTPPIQDSCLLASPKSSSPRNRSRAHTPDRPNWALAPDEPNAVTEPSKEIKHDPMTTPRIDLRDNNISDYIHKDLRPFPTAATRVPDIIVNEFEPARSSVSEWVSDSVPLLDTQNHGTIEDLRVNVVEEEISGSWQGEPEVDSWLMDTTGVGYLEVPQPARRERRKGWDLDSDPYEDRSPSALNSRLRLAPPEQMFQPHAGYPIPVEANLSPPRPRPPHLEGTLKAIVLQPQPSAAVPIRPPHHQATLRGLPTNVGGHSARVLSFFPDNDKEDRNFRRAPRGRFLADSIN